MSKNLEKHKGINNPSIDVRGLAVRIGFAAILAILPTKTSAQEATIDMSSIGALEARDRNSQPTPIGDGVITMGDYRRLRAENKEATEEALRENDDSEEEDEIPENVDGPRPNNS